MKNSSVLVMAAGMGSRYGGLKQLDTVGPSGETIIDYSVFDAIKAGFTKVVFIIRKEFEQEFRSKISDKYAGKIEVEFAFQDVNALPDGFTCPPGREKPWGTAHAILTAAELINEPFVAINGDDFYGSESFKVVADHYKEGSNNFSMVGKYLPLATSEYQCFAQSCDLFWLKGQANFQTMPLVNHGLFKRAIVYRKPMVLNFIVKTPIAGYCLAQSRIGKVKLGDALICLV